MASEQRKKYEMMGVGNSEMVSDDGIDTQRTIEAAANYTERENGGNGVCLGLNQHDDLAHEDWDSGLSKGGGIDRGQGAFPVLLPTLKETHLVASHYNNLSSGGDTDRTTEVSPSEKKIMSGYED